MSAQAHPYQLAGLARALVQAERLTETEAEEFAREAEAGSRSFIAQLIAGGRVTSKEVAEFVSTTFALPLLDLDAIDMSGIPVALVDRKLIETRRVLPLRQRGHKLLVAVSDPSNTQVIDELQFQTGLSVQPIIVEDDKLAAAIARVVQASDASLNAFAADELIVELASIEASPPPEDPASTEADDAPIVRFIQKILTDAIADGASDVHFEPYDKEYRIRMRVDGELREVTTIPVALRDRLASRLKIISKMDIAERRVPQDGRFKLILSRERTIEFRVSSLPTIGGEKIVLRILDSAAGGRNMDTLGYEPEQRDAILKAIHRPYGMILVTGPTGSGKTVSLYSFLSILNKPGVNISTAEDPAEIYMPGINQVNVNEKVGLTFATALRAFLRQDPDIIMVGEIRDLETAEIAVKAAQTGHLLLSTVHTNNAPATITRLLAMGVPHFNVASSLVMITAQQLARRLCSCKAPVSVPDKALLAAGFPEEDLDGSWTPFGPVGCERCRGTGYKGRVGIYEVLPISEEMSRLIMRGANELEIADLARKEGVKDLRQSGLMKVKQGVTSLEEIMVVTND